MAARVCTGGWVRDLDEVLEHVREHDGVGVGAWPADDWREEERHRERRGQQKPLLWWTRRSHTHALAHTTAYREAAAV
jgi:hypothetical protein